MTVMLLFAVHKYVLFLAHVIRMALKSKPKDKHQIEEPDTKFPSCD